jgi:hypothetical protein
VLNLLSTGTTLPFAFFTVGSGGEGIESYEGLDKPCSNNKDNFAVSYFPFFALRFVISHVRCFFL